MKRGLFKFYMFRFQLVLLLGISTLVLGVDLTEGVSGEAEYNNQECGPDIYCLPKQGDLWLPNQSEFVRWNQNYPTFAAAGLVNISLYNTKSETPVKQWPLYTNEGILVISYCYPDWFIGLDSNLSSTANITQEFYFTITSPTTPEALITQGPIFYIERPTVILPTAFAVRPTSSVTSSISTVTSSTMKHSSHSSHSPIAVSSFIPPPSVQQSISAGAIGGIAVGSIVGVTIIACLVYFFLRKRRNQAYNYGIKSNNDRGLTTNNGDNSIPVVVDSIEGVDDTEIPLQMSETPSSIRRNSLRLTVKGAQELAHAYRKMLTNQEAVEEGQSHNQQRSLYSDELLRRELAADGHGVKYVSTTPAIVVVGEDQRSLGSMTADASDSSELS